VTARMRTGIQNVLPVAYGSDDATLRLVSLYSVTSSVVWYSKNSLFWRLDRF
jgi:hypothetical protein